MAEDPSIYRSLLGEIPPLTPNFPYGHPFLTLIPPPPSVGSIMGTLPLTPPPPFPGIVAEDPSISGGLLGGIQPPEPPPPNPNPQTPIAIPLPPQFPPSIYGGALWDIRPPQPYMAIPLPP